MWTGKLLVTGLLLQVVTRLTTSGETYSSTVMQIRNAGVLDKSGEQLEQSDQVTGSKGKRHAQLKPSGSKRIMWMRRRHGLPLINQLRNTRPQSIEDLLAKQHFFYVYGKRSASPRLQPSTNGLSGQQMNTLSQLLGNKGVIRKRTRNGLRLSSESKDLFQEIFRKLYKSEVDVIKR